MPNNSPQEASLQPAGCAPPWTEQASSAGSDTRGRGARASSGLSWRAAGRTGRRVGNPGCPLPLALSTKGYGRRPPPQGSEDTLILWSIDFFEPGGQSQHSMGDMRSPLLRAVWPRGPGCTLRPLEGDRHHPEITVHLGAATPNRPDPGLPSCTSSFSTPKTDKNKQRQKKKQP